MFIDCTSDSQAAAQYIVPLDFDRDFGLTTSDTVTGIKITCLPTFAAADFGGAYIMTQNQVGIESAEQVNPGFYPNPFSELIKISGIKGEAEINLYDTRSRKVLHQEFVSNTTIPTTHIPKGIYFYEIKKDNAVIAKGRAVKD